MDEKSWYDINRCPYCGGKIEFWGFNGNPFCPKCYKYVNPKQISNKTAYEAYCKASKMWSEKLPQKDNFDFVRELLNELYDLGTKNEQD